MNNIIFNISDTPFQARINEAEHRGVEQQGDDDREDPEPLPRGP